MVNTKKDTVIEQANAFKAKYGEYPTMPITVRYDYLSQQSVVGELKPVKMGGYMIFGYPGIVSPQDAEVQNLTLLKDGQNRLFPNIKPKELETKTVFY